MSGTKRNTAFAWAKTPLDTLDLSGKKVAVIGGTDGLGRAIAKAAALKGAEVTVIGRTNRDPGAERITFVSADLSLMRNAKSLGEVLSPDLDVLLLTNGILTTRNREVTAEGLERDMAVSYLSRLAVLDAFLPRLTASTSTPLRIFVMGFPGAGQAGKLGDLNAEQSYKALPQHMQTVAGNEALVKYVNTHLAAQAKRPVEAFGLNPGLIKTGIRQAFLGRGIVSSIVEGLIGMLCISAEQYARNIVPLLFAPELTGKPGLLFNQAADAILPTPAMTSADYVSAFITESKALIDKGLAAQLPQAAA